MQAREILDHFLSKADWVDPEKTVDRIICGDPEKDVRTAGVTWISSFAAVRAAVEHGVDALITHEPTFWKHMNEHEAMDASDIAREKKKCIDDAGLVIIRNHDVWDRFPDVGIPWSWARFLGLPGPPVGFGNRDYQHRYDIDPVTLDELAALVAERTAAIGEPMVQVKGDGAQTVSHVGIGTGCCGAIPEYVAMGCDVSIVCDDGSSYWSSIQQAEDMEHPVIRVSHGTSEEPGMVALTEYINTNLPVEATHLPHGCCFRLVGAGF